MITRDKDFCIEYPRLSRNLLTINEFVDYMGIRAHAIERTKDRCISKGLLIEPLPIQITVTIEDIQALRNKWFRPRAFSEKSINEMIKDLHWIISFFRYSVFLNTNDKIYFTGLLSLLANDKNANNDLTFPTGHSRQYQEALNRMERILAPKQ